MASSMGSASAAELSPETIASAPSAADISTTEASIGVSSATTSDTSGQFPMGTSSGGWAPPPSAMPSVDNPVVNDQPPTIEAGSSSPTPITPTATPVVQPPSTVPPIKVALSSKPLAKVGLKKAVVSPGQTWFATTCADLAPPAVQVSASEASDAAVVITAAVAKSSLLWENGSTITYGYILGASTPGQQAKIDSVIAGFLPGKVNLTLDKVLISPDGSSPAPSIRISCSPGMGSWSYVGQSSYQVSSANATMNLDAISDSSPATIAESGIILHQLLHALGMTHELPSSHRLDPAAVNAFYSYSLGWTLEQVTTNILNVYNAADVSNYSEVDQLSLMMWVLHAPTT
ncbi:hypothetical protein BXZ70DRAFT_363851 [Cristinia sonorae]|uniref:Peptidase metallopeptidase domain-containing protein n=1 Tax=Cristinia sonorae TaxID=1940300 RepID=A0A8K0UJZ6_9AGAR|nr:hypothetical protein BXZ70DRAFT_363851 [Cristinia sonorae]